MKKVYYAALVSLIFLTSQVHSEIFKCKDKSGHITYQETPCVTTTVSSLKSPPAIPREEKLRAQAQTDTMIKNVRQIEQRKAAEEAERLHNEELAIKRAKDLEAINEADALERHKVRLMERTASAAEKAAAEAARRGPTTQCYKSNNGSTTCISR